MPIRKEQFRSGFVYHIYNKTINSFPIFSNVYYSNLFLTILTYYRSSKATFRYSTYRNFDDSKKVFLIKQLQDPHTHLLKILSYCLMPNHFHLLIEQTSDISISRVISSTINSFTKTYNKKFRRLGPLFLPNFKSKLIRTDEQLIHTSRYIHLNPYSSNLATSFADLENYPWSSYKEYLNFYSSGITDTSKIMNLFSNNSNKYKNFIESQANYQRHLHEIQHSRGALHPGSAKNFP